MMLGLLLAREGVEVTVLEKHADFLRDFRGDTIHPSTVQLVDELGFLDELVRLPHQRVEQLRADVNGEWIEIADLSTLKCRHQSILMMPQWDFLELLARKAADHPTFRLVMSAEAIDLLREDGRFTGVVYRRTDGAENEAERVVRLRADLTVACDGRSSTLRARAGARPIELGAPMDVLWFRVPRSAGDPEESFGVIRPGRMVVLIHRGSYWQTGYLVAKGGYERVRKAGLECLRATLAKLAPFFGDGRLAEAISSWDDVKVLSVQVNHLPKWWYPGLLFLGDAAHAMSPIGGVGINLALQDAVAAARILAEPLRRGRATTRELARVQLVRWYPAALSQLAQLFVQRRLIRRVLRGDALRPPRWLKRALRWRPARALLARVVGLGIRPEHWRTAGGPSFASRSPSKERSMATEFQREVQKVLSGSRAEEQEQPQEQKTEAARSEQREQAELAKAEHEKAGHKTMLRERARRAIDGVRRTAVRFGRAAEEKPLVGAGVAGGLIAAAAGVWGATAALLGTAAGIVVYRTLNRRRQREERKPQPREAPPTRPQEEAPTMIA
jgi:2-polyprenyl-6-methoxyphenol hydroxylase-like FAD-dependent oxidoreductase